MPAKKDNEIRLQRVYDAPVKLVWDAWTDPKKAVKWWGPRGFTFTNHSKDLRPGGTWVYTMHGPDGQDFPNITYYHEVIPYSKLVYDHGASETTPPLFRVTVTFEEIKGKTKMDMTMAFESPERAKEIGKFIKLAGGNSTWDRLAEYLSDEIQHKDIFVINRAYEAPIKTVVEMWTNPKYLAKWLPPVGFNMEFMNAEIKTGGSSFYSMSNGEMTFFGKSKYTEVSPKKIVYTQHFADKDGNVSRHPAAPQFPAMMLTTVLFEEEGPNETRVTVSTEVIGEATQEERDFFRAAKPGMTIGWTGSFDKLEELLAH